MVSAALFVTARPDNIRGAALTFSASALRRQLLDLWLPRGSD